MNKHRNAGGYWLGVVVALLLGAGILLVSRVQAEALPAPREVLARMNTTLANIPSPLVIPAAAFSNDGYIQASFFSFNTGELMGADCWKAAVYLPDGVKIDRYFATLYDNDAGGNISVFLRRKFNFYNNPNTQIMGTAVSDGAVASLRIYGDTTILYPYVDHPNYSYLFTACGYSESTSIQSARIYFTYRFSMPIIFK